ncbi:MAG: PKD domain-containing protein [Deltaproteobacteria bacterium]|nr:PKD domain-containing protein [Deltaproteobacteria bacterium]
MKRIKKLCKGTFYLVGLLVLGLGIQEKGASEAFAQAGPVAAFSASPVSGPAPLTVNFTDESTGNIVFWSWEFGDGGTSQDQNPTHQYIETGTYTVRLEVSDASENTAEVILEGGIEVGVSLNAEFSALPASGQPPLLVNFIDLSSPEATRWEWDFDNNGIVDSTVRSPSYVYNEIGTYTVRLVVYDNDNNSNIEIKRDFIRVSEAVTTDSLIQITKFESSCATYPASPNIPITFAAQAISDSEGPLHYKYWIVPDYCSPDYDLTWIEYDYSTNNVFTWTPTEEGNYVIAVYVTDVTDDICPAVARLSLGVYSLGSLEVEVKDATTGDTIEGAVAAVGGLSATTNEEGRATIAGIASGAYELQVSHPTYITAEQEVRIPGNETIFSTVALSPGLAAGETRIVLTWGETPRDLDSHLTGPDGSSGTFHVYYANREPANAGANLDVDDVTSYGPETVTIFEQHQGMYQYHILDYSSGGGSSPEVDANPNATALGQSGARVDVYSGSGLISSFTVPSGYGTNWYVFDLNGATGEVIPVNTLGGGTGPVAGGDPMAFCEENPGYCRGNFQGPDDDTKGLAWDGSAMWVCQGNHSFSVIYKMDVVTEGIDEKDRYLDYFFSPGPNPQGLAWDGTYLWNLDQTDHKIYKIDPTTKHVISSIPTPTSDPTDFYTGLAWDGEYFWVAGYHMALNPETYVYEYSNYWIYKVDSATGAVLRTIKNQLDAEDGFPLGLAYDGDYLWISTYASDQIWRMNMETETISDTGKPAPDNGSYGMTWDGLYLWVGSWYGRYVIQLNPRFIPAFTEEGALRVNIIRVTSNSSVVPHPVDTPITFTTQAMGQASPLFYKYYISPGYCTEGFGEWEEIQGYSASNSVVWTPSGENDYILRVYVGSDITSQCQAMGELSVVVGEGGLGGAPTGSPGGMH